MCGRTTRRLKVNFTVINDKDNALLLKCHREVEEAFEKERWSLVSKAMTREGSEVYMVSCPGGSSASCACFLPGDLADSVSSRASPKCCSASSRSSCTRAPTCARGGISTKAWRKRDRATGSGRRRRRVLQGLSKSRMLHLRRRSSSAYCKVRTGEMTRICDGVGPRVRRGSD